MDIERLKWVIDFANRDLATLREGDWLNLRDDLRRLVDQPILGILVQVIERDIQKHSREQIAELKDSIRQFLKCIAENNMKLADKTSGSKVIAIPSWPLTLEFGPSLSWQSLFKSSQGAAKIEVPPAGIFATSDDVDQGISFAVVLLLAGLHDNLRLCPECDGIFFKVRQQKYCSKKCINAVTRRAWLKDPKNQKKESDWAHKRYEKRVKKLKGENVKVQRRTRKKKGQTK